MCQQTFGRRSLSRWFNIFSRNATRASRPSFRASMMSSESPLAQESRGFCFQCGNQVGNSVCRTAIRSQPLVNRETPCCVHTRQRIVGLSDFVIHPHETGIADRDYCDRHSAHWAGRWASDAIPVTSNRSRSFWRKRDWR